MAKSLAELDREFRARERNVLMPTPAASGTLEALDETFRERRRRRPTPKPKDAPPQGQREAMVVSDEKVVKPPLLSEQERNTMRHKHVVSVVSDVMFYTTMLVLILVAWVFARDGRALGGGTQLFHVLTTSMQSVYPKGSLVVVRPVDPADLVVGNDITYYIDVNTTVTHRIISIIEDYKGAGERAFATKGVDNPSSDKGLVPESALVGKVVFFLPRVGAILSLFRERLWMIVFFFISVVLFSFFLNLTWGETWKARKERRARKVLDQATMDCTWRTLEENGPDS